MSTCPLFLATLGEFFFPDLELAGILRVGCGLPSDFPFSNLPGEEWSKPLLTEQDNSEQPSGLAAEENDPGLAAHREQRGSPEPDSGRFQSKNRSQLLCPGVGLGEPTPSCRSSSRFA